MVATDKVFAGSIPEIYDRFLVPLIFEPYALDLAGRIAATKPQHVLETAAGTGVLTRAIASRLPANARIVATDLNQPMLDQAAAQQPPDRRLTGSRRMRWRCHSRIKRLTSWPASSARCSFPTRFRATGRRAAS